MSDELKHCIEDSFEIRSILYGHTSYTSLDELVKKLQSNPRKVDCMAAANCITILCHRLDNYRQQYYINSKKEG